MLQKKQKEKNGDDEKSALHENFLKLKLNYFVKFMQCGAFVLLIFGRIFSHIRLMTRKRWAQKNEEQK